MNLGKPLCRVVVICALASSAAAKVATISIAELARECQASAVATVTSVEEVAGLRVAFAQRLERVSGRVPERFAFVAEMTWKCDISTAIEGERVLLYLRPITPGARKNVVAAKRACEDKGLPLYELEHAGRGRIPLHLRENQWYAQVKLVPNAPAEICVNLTLPKGAPIRFVRGKMGYVPVSYITSLPRR